MHYFSFEISNAPDWCEEVRRCRTGLNPHFLFVLPKRLPGFPAELYRFGTEKPGGYSLLKRECPPSPLKRNAGGFRFPPFPVPIPLKTTKEGASRPPSLESPPSCSTGCLPAAGAYSVTSPPHRPIWEETERRCWNVGAGLVPARRWFPRIGTAAPGQPFLPLWRNLPLAHRPALPQPCRGGLYGRPRATTRVAPTPLCVGTGVPLA